MLIDFFATLLIGFFCPKPVFAASAMFYGPAQVQQGQTFQVQLMVEDAYDVDTVRFIGAYDSHSIDYQGASNGSALPLRSPGSYLGNGVINFGGFSLGDTAYGNVPIATLTFTALKLGVTHLSFTNGTRVLAYGND